MLNKERYLSLMERVFDVYTEEEIEEYICRVEREGITEHGFPRLTANLDILLAHGRKRERQGTFFRMMELCTEKIPTAKERAGYQAGNDFSVKEVVSCLLCVEKAGLFPDAVTKKWRRRLASFRAEEAYSCVAERPPRPIGNWAAFSAASEQARIYAGLSDRHDFVENQIQSQLFAFDENGMYRDPHEPMVYDSVTRLQLAAALFFGYEGEGKARLCEVLDTSAIPTLKLQSVTGEIPYGGRSNQFLHNECFHAALCEFYAARYAGEDPALAARFRRGAERAVENTEAWLAFPAVSHVKNGYPHTEGMGCENYAYFDKYMITAASWLYLAILFCREDVSAGEEQGDGIFETSRHFHKTVCRLGDWFLEWDTAADPHYDATGLGRIHKRGAPSAILLSVPVPKAPLYRLPAENSREFAIGGGRGDLRPGAEGAVYRLLSHEMMGESARLSFETERAGETVREEYTVTKDAVVLTVRGEGRVFAEVPLFLRDGREATEHAAEGGVARVRYRGYEARMETDGNFLPLETVHNRNGAYRILRAEGEGRVTVRFCIDPAE